MTSDGGLDRVGAARRLDPGSRCSRIEQKKPVVPPQPIIRPVCCRAARGGIGRNVRRDGGRTDMALAKLSQGETDHYPSPELTEWYPTARKIRATSIREPVNEFAIYYP